MNFDMCGTDALRSAERETRRVSEAHFAVNLLFSPNMGTQNAHSGRATACLLALINVITDACVSITMKIADPLIVDKYKRCRAIAVIGKYVSTRAA